MLSDRHARIDTTLTTEGPLYPVGYRCMYAHLLCCTSDISTSAHLLATLGSPYGSWFSQASVPQFASHDTRRHFGLWFWHAPRALGRSAPSSSVEFVKKPSSADQLRLQLRRVQLIRGCLGLQGIRRAQAAAAAAAAAHPACRAAWVGPRSVSTSAVGGTGERRPPLGGARAAARPPCLVDEAHPSCAQTRS